MARNARAKVMKLVKESSEKRMGGWAEGGGVARMEGHDEGEGEMELSALLSCTIASVSPLVHPSRLGGGDECAELNESFEWL